MPETTVDEHRGPGSGENDVRRDADPGGGDREPDPVPEAASVHR